MRELRQVKGNLKQDWYASKDELRETWSKNDVRVKAS